MKKTTNRRKKILKTTQVWLVSVPLLCPYQRGAFGGGLSFNHWAARYSQVARAVHARRIHRAIVSDRDVFLSSAANERLLHGSLLDCERKILYSASSEV